MTNELGAAISLERRLLALESVHDCKVIQRQARAESGQDLEPEQMAAYVVPAWSVRPDCVDEWVASLEKEWPDSSHPDFRAACDLIAVSRLPLTADGQIDEAALAGLPLLDDELTRRWEDRLKSLTGVEDAMVSVELEQEQLPSIHYSQLFSEPQERGNGESAIREVEQPVGQREDPQSNGLAERPLAISHGAELERADRLPLLLGETLQRAAREYPDHGLCTIVDGAEQFLSYPELLARADCLLDGLRRAGLRPGDRVIFQFIRHRGFPHRILGLRFGWFRTGAAGALA